MDTMRKRELWLYVGIWGLAFLMVPLAMSLHYFSGHDAHFPWRDVLVTWRNILPFLLLFILHNHLAIPFLDRRRWGLYVTITLSLLVLFGIYCFSTVSRPLPMNAPAPPNWSSDLPDPRPAPPDGMRPVEPEVMKVVMGLLLILVNLGVKAVFRAMKNERQVQALQTQSLHQQLETLRYQISPHFFMNTLNNIHALVDIDPAKAKESIEELSKLMRIVLYDGSAPTIPLSRELEYLQHYVSLMRLRYPESVEIGLEVSGDITGATVPPLVMASCVENAFKHGISYEASSFVRISLSVEGQEIRFLCENSRHPSQGTAPHGLGLENVHKRLDLLYGPFYVWDIHETAEEYVVTMILPLHKEEDTHD